MSERGEGGGTGFVFTYCLRNMRNFVHSRLSAGRLTDSTHWR